MKEQLRNAELVDRVIFLIEKYIESHDCLGRVEAIILADYPNYMEIFETQVEMLPDEYIMRVRLNNAEKLLEHTEMDFKEISKAIGMNCYIEFTEVFKRFKGINPMSYRNQLLKK